MSAGLASLFIGIGSTVWVYNQFSHRSGNTQSSIIAAAVVGLVLFIVMFTVFTVFLKI